MAPQEMHPRVLREWVDGVAKALSMIFERSWHSGEVPGDWEKGNIAHTFKKDRKESSGNFQTLNLTSVPDPPRRRSMIQGNEGSFKEWSAQKSSLTGH